MIKYANFNTEFIVDKINHIYEYLGSKCVNYGNDALIISINKKNTQEIKEKYNLTTLYPNKSSENGESEIFFISCEHPSWELENIRKIVFNDYIKIFEKYSERVNYMNYISNISFMIETDDLNIIYDILNTLEGYSHCQANKQHFFC